MPPRRALPLLSLLLLAAACDEDRQPEPQHPHVFVAIQPGDFDGGMRGIAAFAGAPSGTAAPDWTFDACGTGDVAYDPVRDTLYALCLHHVVALQGAASGAPSGARSFEVAPMGPMALDPGRDVLYVASGDPSLPGTARVDVYEEASALQGEPAPAQALALPGQSVNDLVVDGARGRLYVAVNGEVNAILALSLVPGSAAEPQVLVSADPEEASFTSVALDPLRDRLYLSALPSEGAPSVHLLEDASTREATAALLELPRLPLGHGTWPRLDYDPYRDTLYLLGGLEVSLLAAASTADPDSPVTTWDSCPGCEWVGWPQPVHAAFAP